MQQQARVACESELEHWFDQALVDVRFGHDSVPGRRRAPKIFYREGPSGFALLPESELDPVIEGMLPTGAFWMNFRLPDPHRFRLAALKHAYLAACLYLGYVPRFPEADQVRADLMAARDTPKRLPPPASAHADRLSLYRSERPPAGPPLAIVVTRRDGPDDQQEHLISLAGTVFVSWPFSIVPPTRNFQIVPMFE